MADDGSNKNTETKSDHPESGSGVLFGWLVGRAAADLGLAQALAATEAERAQEFKRLEERLLGQIRTLQNQSKAAADSIHQHVELDELKEQLENVIRRVGVFDSLADQMRHSAAGQASSPESRFDQRQNLVEVEHVQTRQQVDCVLEKLADIERRIGSLPENYERARSDLAGLEQDLVSLSARTESWQQELQAKIETDIAAVRDLAANLVRVEVADLKGQIIELRQRQNATEEQLGAIAVLRREIQELHRQFDRSSEDDRFAAEVAEVREHLFNLIQQVEALERTAGATIDFEAERTRMTQEVSQRLTASAAEVAADMRRQWQELAEIKANRGDLDQAIESLSARVVSAEQASGKTNGELARELCSVKTTLDERESRFTSIEAQCMKLGQTVGAALEEIQKHFGIVQQHIDACDTQDHNAKSQLEQIGRRVAEIESMAHQTRALMINESTQTAQQRDGFAAELASLSAQLRAANGWEAAIQAMEDRLEGRVRELRNELAQKIPNLERRNSDVSELKAWVETLAEKLATLESGSRSTRAVERAPVPLEPMRPIGAPEEDLKIGVFRTVDESKGSAPKTRSADQAIPEGQVLTADPLRILQARMSADIERARAELREKSGRWKARQ